MIYFSTEASSRGRYERDLIVEKSLVSPCARKTNET